MLTLRTILRPRRVVDAHCDIPCGIYDPTAAEVDPTPDDREVRGHRRPAVARCILVKEEHAELGKHHLKSSGATTSSPSTSRSTRACTRRSGRPTSRPARSAVARRRCREGAVADDRLDRRGVEGHRRPREDTGQRAPFLSVRCAPALTWIGVAIAAGAEARRWLDVVEVRGRSMAPTLLPGDRLVSLDCTGRRGSARWSSRRIRASRDESSSSGSRA